jgi:hypothetical protein
LPELAPSQLVEFQVIEAPAAQPWDIASSGTRVQARFTLYRGDDGSEGWAFKGLLDQERSEWCKVGSLTDGSLHCAPKGMTPTMGPHYSDPSCAKLAMEVPKSLGCQQDSRLRPYLAEPVVVEGCARQRTYDYPLSPLGQLYDNSSGTCAEVPLPDHTDAFVETATPEIFPSAFVAATEVSSDSPAEILSGQRLTGRRWRHRGFDGFTTWLRDELIDTVRAEPCSPNLFEDGRFHCVPSFDEVILGADEILYADAQCSQSVVGVLPRSACYPSTRYVSFPVTVRGCPAVRLALRSDVSTTVSQLYVRRLGQCVEDTSTDPSLCAFFAVSRRFDPSDFVELSPAWEP